MPWIRAYGDRHRKEAVPDQWRLSLEEPLRAPFPLLCIESAPVQTDRLRGKVTHTSETIQSELVDLVQSCRVLEVVLDDIDVVGGGQEAGICRGFGIPQRCRNNPYNPTVSDYDF